MTPYWEKHYRKHGVKLMLELHLSYDEYRRLDEMFVGPVPEDETLERMQYWEYRLIHDGSEWSDPQDLIHEQLKS